MRGGRVRVDQALFCMSGRNVRKREPPDPVLGPQRRLPPWPMLHTFQIYETAPKSGIARISPGAGRFPSVPLLPRGRLTGYSRTEAPRTSQLVRRKPMYKTFGWQGRYSIYAGLSIHMHMQKKSVVICHGGIQDS